MKEKTEQQKFLRDVATLYVRGVAIKAKKKPGSILSGGEPDVYGCYGGRMFQIEFKVPGKLPTEKQAKSLDEWREAGAKTGVAVTAYEAFQIIGIEPQHYALLDVGPLRERSRIKKEKIKLDKEERYDGSFD